MINFEKFWKELQEGKSLTSVDKDKIRWGYERALRWVLRDVIVEKLKLVSMDDNVACVRRIQEAIRHELGEPPTDCVRDGFRLICKGCIRVEQCKQESTEL